MMRVLLIILRLDDADVVIKIRLLRLLLMMMQRDGLGLVLLLGLIHRLLRGGGVLKMLTTRIRAELHRCSVRRGYSRGDIHHRRLGELHRWHRRLRSHLNLHLLSISRRHRHLRKRIRRRLLRLRLLLHRPINHPTRIHPRHRLPQQIRIDRLPSDLMLLPVRVQVILPLEPPPAEIALELVFGGVRAAMSGEGGGVVEGFAAEGRFADERALVVVSAHVPLVAV